MSRFRRWGHSGEEETAEENEETNSEKNAIKKAVLILILFPTTVFAEWVRVDDFGGLITQLNPTQMGVQNARLMNGWYVQDGDLLRITLEKRDTLVAAAPAQGVNFLAPYEEDDDIIYARGGALWSHSISSNSSTPLSQADSDSIKVTSGSKLAYYAGDNLSNSRWLNMVMVANTPSNRGSIDIGGAEYDFWMFLSDTLVVLVNDHGETVNPDTLNWLVGFSGNTNRPLYWFKHTDTVSIMDGDNRTSYNGLDIGAIKWPLYSDSGSYDSVGTDTVQIKDSMLVYGNFTFDGNYTSPKGGYLLLSDHTDSAHAIPFFIMNHLDDGAGHERLHVIGDTSQYLRDDGSGLIYGDRFNPTGGSTRRFLVYDTASGSFSRTGNYFVTTLFAGRLDTISQLDCGSYNYRALIGDNAPSWMYDTRAMDGAIYRIRHNQFAAQDSNSWSVRVSEVFGLDSLYLIYWGWGATGWTQRFQQGANKVIELDLHRFPPVPYEKTTEQNAFQYDIVLKQPHRDRLWAAEDRTVAYSDLNDWYDIVGGGTVPFEKPITGLSSFGNEMIAHLGGDEIQTWTGYAEADFYKVPASVSVSAMNHGSLAHNNRDNSDVFPHPLGLWRYTGGGVQEIETGCREIFTDSINWVYAGQMVGAVYDNKYWLGAPFGSSEKNDRLLTIELESGKVSFLNIINPGSFYVRTDPEVGEQLWIGDADSSILWLVDSDVSEVPYTTEMRSGWLGNEDRTTTKLVRSYTLGYTAKRDDSIFVDFYDGSEQAGWSDTIVVSTGGGQSFGNTDVETDDLSITSHQTYGSLFTPLTSGYLDSARFYIDWTGLDGGELCTVAVALYSYNEGGVMTLVDSCYGRTFAAGEADGWKKFDFANTNSAVDAGGEYLLWLRMTVAAGFTVILEHDNSSGTQVQEGLYSGNSITTSWVTPLNCIVFGCSESVGSISSAVFYSERLVQEHYAHVPRGIQGTALSYGLRTPSDGVEIHDFAMDVVTLGRRRP